MSAETPVERRLREMVAAREVPLDNGRRYRPSVAVDIDAGREAIKLLAEIRGECSSRDLADMLGTALLAKLDDLLARCEETR